MLCLLGMHSSAASTQPTLQAASPNGAAASRRILPGHIELTGRFFAHLLCVQICRPAAQKSASCLRTFVSTSFFSPAQQTFYLLSSLDKVTALLGALHASRLLLMPPCTDSALPAPGLQTKETGASKKPTDMISTMLTFETLLQLLAS